MCASHLLGVNPSIPPNTFFRLKKKVSVRGECGQVGLKDTDTEQEEEW